MPKRKPKPKPEPTVRPLPAPAQTADPSAARGAASCSDLLTVRVREAITTIVGAPAPETPIAEAPAQPEKEPA